jgi:RimJ/RimL family protein N-acetyltransferase
MFTIIMGPDNVAAGSLGYWEREWDGQKGCGRRDGSSCPSSRGRGIAVIATRMRIERVAKLDRRFLFAYPSVNNGPSNAICRRLGFMLTSETESEYPSRSGRVLRVNVWRLGLKKLVTTD